MKLVDKQADDTFGKFFGHPEGESRSKEYVLRMLKEFDLTPGYFEDLILSVSVPQGGYVTALQDPLRRAFTKRGWFKSQIIPNPDTKQI